MKIRVVDLRMLAKGFVTARMVAAKVGVHVWTVRRMITDGRIPARAVMTLGNTQYINSKDLSSAFGDAGKIIDFNDWRDIVGAAGSIVPELKVDHLLPGERVDFKTARKKR